VAVATSVLPVNILPYTGGVLPPPELEVLGGWVVFVVSVLAVAGALLLGRRWPVPAFAFLWFAVCYAPVSGLVPLKTYAESRFLYLPLFGFGLLLGVAIPSIRQRLVRPVTVVLLVLLAALSFRESGKWRTDLDLWGTSVERQERIVDGVGGVAAVNWAFANLVEAGKVSSPERKVLLRREALRYFERAARGKPKPIDLLNLATALIDLGERDRALLLIQRAARSAPEDSELLIRSGDLMLRIGEPARARDYLDRGARLAPKVAYAHLKLARACLELGEMREARKVARDAIRLAPLDPSAWILLGNVEHGELNLAEAERAYTRARELAPGHAHPLLFLARVRMDQERYPEALRLLRAAERLSPENSAVRAEILAASLATGRIGREEAVLGLMQAVGTLLERRDTASAVVVLNRPCVRKIEEPRLDNLFAQILLDSGNLEWAREEFLKLVEKRPEDVFAVANAGLIELRIGRHEAAVGLLEKAVELDAATPVLRMALARAYRGVDRKEDAERMARTVLSMPDLPDDLRRDATGFLESD
jgi:Flp pilus assembly protein TadD